MSKIGTEHREIVCANIQGEDAACELALSYANLIGLHRERAIEHIGVRTQVNKVWVRESAVVVVRLRGIS